MSFHDYFTGIFEPKILSALVDFDLSCMHHFHWGGTEKKKKKKGRIHEVRYMDENVVEEENDLYIILRL